MVTSIPPNRTQPMHAIALWDGLLDAVLSARDAAAGGDLGGAERAVTQSCDLVSELYATLDPTRSPVVAMHLQSVLDACLNHLAGARDARDARDARQPARLAKIDATLLLLRPVRAAISM